MAETKDNALIPGGTRWPSTDAGFFDTSSASAISQVLGHTRDTAAEAFGVIGGLRGLKEQQRSVLDEMLGVNREVAPSLVDLVRGTDAGFFDTSSASAISQVLGHTRDTAAEAFGVIGGLRGLKEQQRSVLDEMLGVNREVAPSLVDLVRGTDAGFFDTSSASAISQVLGHTRDTAAEAFGVIGGLRGLKEQQRSVLDEMLGVNREVAPSLVDLVRGTDAGFFDTSSASAISQVLGHTRDTAAEAFGVIGGLRGLKEQQRSVLDEMLGVNREVAPSLVDLVRGTDAGFFDTSSTSAISQEGDAAWRETNSGLWVPYAAQVVAFAVALNVTLLLFGLYVQQMNRLEQKPSDLNYMEVAMLFFGLWKAQRVVQQQTLKQLRKWDRTTGAE